MNRIANLRQSHSLIEAVRDSMDNRTRTCECCGLSVHENWEEKQVRDILSGVLNKLDKVVERLEGNQNAAGNRTGTA